jgi:hypothetical protein
MKRDLLNLSPHHRKNYKKYQRETVLICTRGKDIDPLTVR